jgi:hypothetical protein
MLTNALLKGSSRIGLTTRQFFKVDIGHEKAIP